MKKEPLLLSVIAVILLIGLFALLSLVKNALPDAPEPLASATVTPAVSSTPVPTASTSPAPSEARLDDLIVVTSPLQNATITSPLTIKGSARGTWYSEAVFPIVLIDANGTQIAQGQAEAQGEWMTEDYVPFTATLTFTKPASVTGSLVLKKDNPSGLPANENSLVVPVKF